MDVRVNQKREKRLYGEHVDSLHANIFWGKNELTISIILLITSLVLIFLLEQNGIAFSILLISLTSLLMYPHRKNRWINNKTKKSNHMTIEKYSFTEDTIIVTDNTSSTTIAYSFFHSIIITNTGILFFVNPFLHLYISYNSFQSKEDKESVCNLLSSLAR